MKDKEKQFRQECQLIANGKDLPEDGFVEDKEKQIEEMAKDIVHQKMFGPCIFENCPFGKDNEILCNNCKVAQYLHNKHYRKLPKDSVVLSREDYEILTKDIEHPTDEVLKKLVVGKNILTEKAIEKTSKETAEKFAKGLIKIIREKDTYLDWDDVLEFAKQFGVEIKE